MHALHANTPTGKTIILIESGKSRINFQPENRMMVKSTNELKASVLSCVLFGVASRL